MITIGLVSKIYKQSKQNKFAIVPIDKKNIIFSSDGTLRFFYEPKSNTYEKGAGRLKDKGKLMNDDALNEIINYSTIKPLSTYRIVALGDSFTYGLYVKTIDNWPKQLEHILNSNLMCNQINKFEVINLGVYGYDIQYSIERFKRRGQKYNPDLVLWFLKSDDINQINELMLPIHKKYMAMVNKKYPEKIQKDSYYDWELTVNEIQQQYGENSIFDLQKKILNDFNIYYKNPLLIFSFPTIKDNEKDLLRNYVKTRRDSYYFDKATWIYSDRSRNTFSDGHPNENGYKIIAQDLFKYLTSKNIIPCK